MDKWSVNRGRKRQLWRGQGGERWCRGCAMVEAPRDSWEAVNSAINEYFHQLVILPAITLALTQPPWHSGVIGTWATLPNPYTINIYKKHIYLFFRLRLAD